MTPQMNNNKEKWILAAVAGALLAVAAFFVFINVPEPATPASRNQPNPREPEPVTTTLFFAGDIMLSREVRGKILQADNVNLPFLNTADAIKQADLAFANLESPFNDQGQQSANRLIFKAEPNTVTGLTNAGFDVISTANNHAFDQGRAAVTYTYDWLKQNGITPIGTGLDCHQGQVKTVNGIRFGFLAYSYAAFNDGGAVPDELVCDWNDSAQIAKDVQALKPQVDFLIVSGHFGPEYQRRPTSIDAGIARSAIDAGADMLIGHHPHWVQTIEEYNGKYIFYSLGNFVFDQMWSQDTMEGLTAEIAFKDKVLDEITLRPVIIENYCCPRWTTALETQSILNKINPGFVSATVVKDGKTQPDWAQAVSKINQLSTP